MFKSSTVALMISAILSLNAQANESHVTSSVVKLPSADKSQANENNLKEQASAFVNPAGDIGIYIVQLSEKPVLDKTYSSLGDDRKSVLSKVDAQQNKLISTIQSIDEEAVISQRVRMSEHYAVEDAEGNLFVSRENTNGIWLFNIKSKTFNKLTNQLKATDFSSFFWENDDLYFLVRSPEKDRVVKFNGGELDTVVELPAHSIRKFAGIAKAEKDSLLLTIKSSNDADIYEISIQ